MEYKDLSKVYAEKMTYDKFKKDKDFTVELTDKIIDDFKMVDLSIIENAVL